MKADKTDYIAEDNIVNAKNKIESSEIHILELRRLMLQTTDNEEKKKYKNSIEIAEIDIKLA